MTLTYEEVAPIDRMAAERIFRNEHSELIPETLVRVTFYEPDWHWAQEWCLVFATSSNLDIQKVALTCLGHLARIHGKLDTKRVLALLNPIKDDPPLSGIVQDVLDDISVFIESSD